MYAARATSSAAAGLGVHRWAAGQGFALVPAAALRWQIRDDIHEAFLSLACGIICWRRLTSLSLCQAF